MNFVQSSFLDPPSCQGGPPRAWPRTVWYRRWQITTPTLTVSPEIGNGTNHTRTFFQHVPIGPRPVFGLVVAWWALGADRVVHAGPRGPGALVLDRVAIKVLPETISNEKSCPCLSVTYPKRCGSYRVRADRTTHYEPRLVFFHRPPPGLGMAPDLVVQALANHHTHTNLAQIVTGLITPTLSFSMFQSGLAQCLAWQWHARAGRRQWYMRGPAALERSVLDSVAIKVLPETISNEKYARAFEAT